MTEIGRRCFLRSRAMEIFHRIEEKEDRLCGKCFERIEVIENARRRRGRPKEQNFRAGGSTVSTNKFPEDIGAHEAFWTCFWSTGDTLLGMRKKGTRHAELLYLGRIQGKEKKNLNRQ